MHCLISNNTFSVTEEHADLCLEKEQVFPWEKARKDQLQKDRTCGFMLGKKNKFFLERKPERISYKKTDESDYKWLKVSTSD